MVARADNEVKVTITVDNEQAMKSIAEVQEALKPFVWLGIVKELAASDPIVDFIVGQGCNFCKSKLQVDEATDEDRIEHKPDCLWIRARKAVCE